MSSFEEQEIALLRQRIVRLEEQVERLYKRLGFNMDENGTPDDDPRVIEALKKGQAIEAIKIYRELTGLGLAEAKLAVEKIWARIKL
jgi:ribosomal protein L7/L12